MKYIDATLFKFQLFVQLALIACFLLFNLNFTIQSIISGAFLCVVGIPHGANDYLFRKNQTATGLLKFLISYLAIIFGYGLLWYFSPIIALILFFVISFHHFGQSNFENESILHPSSILWGIFLIAIPVILHFNEAIVIFKSILNFDHNYSIDQNYTAQITVWQIASVSTIVLAYLVSIYRFHRNKFLSYGLQVLLITFWYIITPLLFGFIIVFCLWHSIQALEHQKTYFKLLTKKSSLRFYLSMLPFSSIAIAVFIFYLYFFDFNIGGAFILLSLITLPHVFISHELYNPALKTVK